MARGKIKSNARPGGAMKVSGSTGGGGSTPRPGGATKIASVGRGFGGKTPRPGGRQIVKTKGAKSGMMGAVKGGTSC